MDGTIRTSLSRGIESLAPAASLVAALADLQMAYADEATGLGLTVEELTLDLPVEFAVDPTPSGRLRLTAAPAQQVATSLMPAVHRLRLRVTRDPGDGE